MLILGLDPSLACTGWGLIRVEGNKLRHVANGQIPTNAKSSLPDRLLAIDSALAAILSEHHPDAAAVEEVFVNTNAQSTLKLGQARGVVMLAAARSGASVHEYAARLVKKSIVGSGRADKGQIQAMLQILLPGAKVAGADAADALAVAITHAHHRSARR